MIQPGTLLQNRYRVAAQIGKGGMGEVYAATDERFQSKVAIKRTFFDDAEMSRAFKREARLLNHLRHPALPKVTDHFEEDGGQFLVMEFMEGSDLAELMKRRKVPFPLTDVLRWADQLLDALEYLHAQEPAVVHRDIKPPNIKLTPEGKVVLLDFGLAKGAPSQTASGPASSVYGFSHNFAPLEQMEGTGTGPGSDLYSLAATLYFLLTGLRPPDAMTRAVAAIKDQPDPLRHAHLVQPQVPAAIGQILHRAMSQNSEPRHASARELREALRLAANDPARAKVLPQRAPTPLAATPIQPSQHSALDPTQSSSLSRKIRPTPAVETSVKDSRRTSPAYVSETTAVRDKARPAGPKLIFACVLLICAAAGAYLLARPTDTPAPVAADGAQAQNPAPTLDETAPAPDAVSSDSRQTTAVTDSSSEPVTAHDVDGTTTTDSRPVAQASGATDSAGPNTTASGETAAGPNGATTTSTGRPALVIQNPAPAATPTQEPTREQTAYPPPYPDRPPPREPYPPPPGDRRPPPPDGRRPPPPHFRP